MPNKYLEPLVLQRVHIDKVVVCFDEVENAFYISGWSDTDARYYYYGGCADGWQSHRLGMSYYIGLQNVFGTVSTFNMQEVTIDASAFELMLALVKENK